MEPCSPLISSMASKAPLTIDPPMMAYGPVVENSRPILWLRLLGTAHLFGVSQQKSPQACASGFAAVSMLTRLPMERLFV